MVYDGVVKLEFFIPGMEDVFADAAGPRLKMFKFDFGDPTPRDVSLMGGMLMPSPCAPGSWETRPFRATGRSVILDLRKQTCCGIAREKGAKLEAVKHL